MPTLHLYLDESGDLNFKAAGTRYYVFAAAWTYDPHPIALDLSNLRFSLLKQGFDIQSFHATEDRQINRNAVLDILERHQGRQHGAIIVEKAKVDPSLYEPQRFYPEFAGMLLRQVLSKQVRPTTETVMVFTDVLPVERHREAVAKAIKSACRAQLGDHMPFHAYHHPRGTNCWIQAVDYCSWAMYIKWQRNEMRPYDRLLSRLAAPESEVLRDATTRFY